jgi:hypothetical protein
MSNDTVYIEKQTHELSERRLEYIDSQYNGIGLVLCGVFLLGLFLLFLEEPARGAGLMLMAMLGFILRRIRIEGEKTRRKLKSSWRRYGKDDMAQPRQPPNPKNLNKPNINFRRMENFC